MNLVDIGINLAHDSFDHDRESVVETARAAGVARFIITGTDLAGSREALQMADSINDSYCTAGVHPHHASELDAAGVDALHELLTNEKTVAVGECGLDFFRNFSPPDDQRRAFRLQLELAAECGKPLFLHQRDAHKELMQMLQDHRNELPAGGVVHCFTDGPAELEEILEAGFHVGITGWLCDERRGRALREAVKLLLPDHFMVETDAPYLLPRDLPKNERKAAGRRNEPRFLPHIVEKLAELMDREPAEIASLSTANAERLFRLPPRPAG